MKKVGCAVLALLALAVFIAIPYLFSGKTEREQQSAIKTACVWARLNPFPASARDVKVDIAGSMFSREINISFTADAANIAAWLQQSPGISDAEEKHNPDGSIHYKIKPHEAQFAELTLSPDKTTVTIRVYWS